MSLIYPIFNTELKQSFKRYWDHNRLKDQEFKEILGRSQSFKNCFEPNGINLTGSLRADIKKRTKGKIPLSVVIQIFGKQGSGKTKLGFEFAKRIDPRFSARKVFMKPEALLDYCKYAKINDCLILDEQAIEFGEGSLRQAKELQNIEEITRIKQLHFIYCSPTLREHLACHYTIKVIQKNYHDRITKFAFCNQLGSYYYGYGLAYIPKDEDCQIWQKYEPKKLKYVDQVLQRSSQKYDIWEKADQVVKHHAFRYAKSRGDLAVICQDLWPTLTTGEHKKIINALMMVKRSMSQKV